MYDYPNATGIEGFLSYPTQASPYFWLWILGVIFTIFTLTSYYKEMSIFGKGKLLSSLVVSSFFVSVLAIIGSVIGFITTEILVYILVMFAIFTAIFIFSSKD